MAESHQQGFLRGDAPAGSPYGPLVVEGTIDVDPPEGGATEAAQETQTTHLAAIETATEAIQTTEGATGDAAATAGGTGTISAKLRAISRDLVALLPGSLGQKTSANSLAVVVASDQSAVPVSGTVTVNSLPAGTNNIGDVDVLTLPALPAGANNIGQVDPRGNVAHDAADSGNPIKTGGRARTALPAAVAQDDRTDAVFDKHGRQLMVAAPIDQLLDGRLNKTDNTAGDVIAAQGAGIAIVVTSVVVTNKHATVGTNVSVRKGTTAVITNYADNDGGGFVLQNPNGLFVTAANAAVTAICATTGADVDVTVLGYAIPA